MEVRFGGNGSWRWINAFLRISIQIRLSIDFVMLIKSKDMGSVVSFFIQQVLDWNVVVSHMVEKAANVSSVIGLLVWITVHNLSLILIRHLIDSDSLLLYCIVQIVGLA